jgi:hypothetical protein
MSAFCCSFAVFCISLWVRWQMQAIKASASLWNLHWTTKYLLPTSYQLTPRNPSQSVHLGVENSVHVLVSIPNKKCRTYKPCDPTDTTSDDAGFRHFLPEEGMAIHNFHFFYLAWLYLYYLNTLCKVGDIFAISIKIVKKRTIDRLVVFVLHEQSTRKWTITTFLQVLKIVL